MILWDTRSQLEEIDYTEAVAREVGSNNWSNRVRRLAQYVWLVKVQLLVLMLVSKLAQVIMLKTLLSQSSRDGKGILVIGIGSRSGFLVGRSRQRRLTAEKYRSQ